MAYGCLNLKPWELREYSFDEFLKHVKGYQLAQAYEWDRTRNIMFAVVKATGAKGIKKVTDIMRLPLIDKVATDKSVYSRLKQRLEQFKKDAGTST